MPALIFSTITLFLGLTQDLDRQFNYISHRCFFKDSPESLNQVGWILVSKCGFLKYDGFLGLLHLEDVKLEK